MSCPAELDCPFYPACQKERWFLQFRVKASNTEEAEVKFREVGRARGYEVLDVRLLTEIKPGEYEGSIEVASGQYRVVSQPWWDVRFAEAQAEALRRLTGQDWHVVRTEPPQLNGRAADS